MDERQERGTSFAPTGSDKLVIDIANPRANSYRHQIHTGMIAELDLRSYLFASRLDLLRKDRKYVEACDRGHRYLNAMQQRCKEEASKPDSPTPSIFPYLWGFLAAR